MNEETKKVCLNCERTDEVIPLLHFTFKNETNYILMRQNTSARNACRR